MDKLIKMANGNDKRISGNRIQLRLVDQVKCPELWPTPTRSAATGACKHGDGGLDLQTAVKFPTPTNSMMTVGDMEQAKYSGNSGKRPKYQDCNTYPTPTVITKKQTGRLDEYGGSGNPFRGTEEGKGNLNADWVEWLMGWFIGWSNIEPLKELVWLNPSIDPHPEPPRVSLKSKNRTNRLKVIGNGQYPLCAAEAWRILS